MRILTPQAAVGLIPAGSTVAICGTANVGVPEVLLSALGERYRETGEPGDLTLYFPVEPGDRPGVGIDHLAQPGMLRCLIAGSYIFTGSRQAARTTRLVLEDKIAAYNLPMGVMFLLLRDIAAGRPGHITDVGIGTFVEPAMGGGKLTKLATTDLVEYVEVAGKTYLRYVPVPIDVALIRGTTADDRGNLSLEHEASSQGMLAMAQAAKAADGLVVAEVQRTVRTGAISPHAVRVPGALIDVIVVDPEQEQLLGEPFRPELCSHDVSLAECMPASAGLSPAVQVIVRRAAQEIRPGDRVNLGYGMAAHLPLFKAQETPGDYIHFFVEQGAIGGVPLPGNMFGTSLAPDALLDMPSWFDYLEGGSFTAACLGFGQADGTGSVNNHRPNGLLTGCGGFIDITTRVPRIIFCGTFTAGGLRVSCRDGHLVVDREGRHQKFVDRVYPPTLSGPLCIKRGQRVTWITERAVLELDRDGLVVTEIAPGISPTQLQAAAGCSMRFAPDLVKMDPGLFAASPERDKTT
ncbi:MAG TPA: CoA-transferase [Acidobacteriaceae bacterium]|nr:CoA-transferase [Acidobacteriaceae bacterium]